MVNASGPTGARGDARDARRPMRARGRSGASRSRAAPWSANDAGVALGAVLALGASAWLALAPSPFDTVAPITIGDAPLETAELEPALAPPASQPLDPAPLGALGDARGTVDETPSEPSGGMKVIEVSPAGTAAPVGPVIVRDPSNLRQPLRIAHLPDKALIEEGEHGPLPVTRSGRRPLDVYAGHWSGRRGKRIALVVGGIGISQTGSQAAIETLPGSVTLGFAPAGNSLRRWMEAARRDGHELLLQLPMQAFGRGEADPRGFRLSTELSDPENAERLRKALSRTTNYVGVMNYTGGAFLSDRDALYPIARELRDRGLMMLDDGSSAQSRAGEVAGDLGLPFAAADAAVDLDRDPEAIEDQLRRLEEMARGTGSAIGVASAFPQTVEAIDTWIAGVESRGFEIVPVSVLARDPSRR